jgi:hypothetical protein
LGRDRLIFDMIGDVINVAERLQSIHPERVKPPRAHRGGLPEKQPQLNAKLI